MLEIAMSHDAVDPHVGSTGKPTPRDKNGSDDLPQRTITQVIATRFEAYHKEKCDLRWPNLIMAPRRGQSEPVLRYRKDYDQPAACTCGLLDDLAAVLSVPCRVCGGSGFVAQKRTIDDGYGEVDSCPACEPGAAVLSVSPEQQEPDDTRVDTGQPSANSPAGSTAPTN